MARNINSDIAGKPFGKTTVGEVWHKGRKIGGFDANVWRHDICGRPMRFSDYGNINSSFGWEVDHVKSVAKGGTDNLSNLKPLQWENNRDKDDTFPWKLLVTRYNVAD